MRLPHWPVSSADVRANPLAANADNTTGMGLGMTRPAGKSVSTG